MRALEAAKALGSTESAEEILQSVADKIEVRQRQQQSKSSSSVSVRKLLQSLVSLCCAGACIAVNCIRVRACIIIISYN